METNPQGTQHHKLRCFPWRHFATFVLSLAVILAYCNPTMASEDQPSSLVLTRDDGLEEFMGFCTSIAPGKVKCEFEGVRIVLPSETLAGEFLSLLRELEKEVNREDEQKLQEVFEENCRFMTEMSQEDLSSSPTPIELKESLQTCLQRKIPSICSRKPKSKEQFVEAFRKLATVFSDCLGQVERRCCGLFTQTWEMEFTQISSTKWVNTPEASGLCKITKLYELEKTGEGIVGGWTLTGTRISADTTSPRCKDVQLMKPIRWSSDGPGYLKLPCDYIDWSKFN